MFRLSISAWTILAWGQVAQEANKDYTTPEGLRTYGYELLSQTDHGANQYILILKKKM
jgi:hypothetical protein